MSSCRPLLRALIARAPRARRGPAAARAASTAAPTPTAGTASTQSTASSTTASSTTATTPSTHPDELAPPSFDDLRAEAWASGVGLVHPDGRPPAPMSASVAEQFHALKQQARHLDALGTDIRPHYQPHTLLTNPPAPADVTLELLLASEAHQGHATSLWNPANARYIHGIRQGVHIIALEATAAHLRRAAKVVHEVSRRAGIVLFVGTRDGHDRAVSRAAELAKAYHLFERWIPGSITNGKQILGRCKTKVVNEHDADVAGFDDQLYDRPVLRPDLVVCLNPLENYVLLHECALNNIPTIGVIDTNADPTWVTYPIPANDDSLRCIQVIAGVLGRAGEAGQKQRLAAAARGEITYRPARGLVAPESEEEAAEVAQVKKGKRSATATDAVSAPEAIDHPEAAADAEFARHLDEVNSREDHRQKGGRSIKFSD